MEPANSNKVHHCFAVWDNEGDGWLITSPEIKGLIIFGVTAQEIVRKLRLVIPGLCLTAADDVISVRFGKGGPNLLANLTA
jgi:hypothetical protein